MSTKTTKKEEFVKFLGGTALNFLSVGIYRRQDDMNIVRVEHAVNGKTMLERVMSDQELNAFEERCTDGLYYQDAGILVRAFRELGFEFKVS